MFRSRLKHPADYRSLVTMFFILALEAFTILNFRSLNRLTLAGLLSALMICVFTATLINHNHRHQPFFDSTALNKLTNYFLTLAAGAPSTRLHLVHIMNHHVHYKTTNDWSHYSLAGKRRGFLRTMTYYFQATYKIARSRGTLKFSTRDRNELFIEYGLFATWLIAWAFVDLKATVIVFVTAYMGGQFILLIGNLINHDECELSSNVNHARTFHSRFENWLLFNHGFHAVHHRRPSLHWTYLAKVHNSHFAEQTRPDLLKGSFFIYFLTRYLFWFS